VSIDGIAVTDSGSRRISAAGALVDSLTEWLGRLGLGQYRESFAQNNIDFEILPLLTDDEFKELGLTVGHRVKLKAAIASLAHDSSPPSASAAASQPEFRSSEAELRQLTVMFCDLVGSTALSTLLDAEDYRDLIRSYQDTCVGVITGFDGFIAKFMGDGILVYFGWPLAHEDDAERAINAGLAISDAVRALSTDKGKQLAVRVGIATGHVVVGDIVGERAAQEAAIAGEAPNLAARLQAIAAPNTIVIGEATYAIAGSLFECADLGPQALKGFAVPVNAWQVATARAFESRFEATRMRTSTPFVGREEEINILQRRWQRACAGEGQVVLISGEPGIGKSRMVSELEQRIGGQQHIRLRYQCSPNHTSSALYPVIDQLERTASIQRSDSSDDKLAKLEAILTLPCRPATTAMPLIAPLLSIPFGNRYQVANVSPQRQKQMTLAMLVDYIAGLAEQSPVLFHWEDAHWIDPTSRELLDLTVARTAGLAVLACISFRPEFTPAWTGEKHVTLLALNRLEAPTCAHLAIQTAGAAVLSSNIVDEIVMRADGVPLFVEEMTKTVLEVRLGAGGSIDARPRIAIPASIEDSLTARLDRLGPVKEVAQIASALGRTFSHDVLAAVVPIDETALGEALERLIASGLVYRSTLAGALAYEFKHALIRDAAYQSLLKSRRQRHHARIAEVLETQFSAVTEPELLAHHYTEAGHLGQAIDYWIKAGQRAMLRSAHIEAEQHLRKGLELIPNLQEMATRFNLEIALQNTLGVCMMPTRGFGNPDVAAAFMRAAEICEKVDDARGLFVALRGKGQYDMVSGDILSACADTRRIIGLAEHIDDPELLLEAHHLGWSALCLSGEFRAAQCHAEEGMERYERHRDHHLTYKYSGHDPGMCCRAFGSLSLSQLGYSDRALALCHDGLTLAETLSHPFTVGIALWATGVLHQLRREPHATREIGAHLIHYCSEKGLRPLVPLGKVFCGDALARGGGHAEGIAQMQEGIAELRSSGNLATLPSFFLALASAHAGQGTINEGLAALEEGLALARKGGELFSLPEFHRMKAELLLARSAANKVEAVAGYSKAIEVARGQHARLLELRAAACLARLWGEGGRRQAGRELLQPIYGSFTEGFDTVDLRDAKTLLDELA
jgi:class 3 adenylate cyclase/predicted ATPase